MRKYKYLICIVVLFVSCTLKTKQDNSHQNDTVFISDSVIVNDIELSEDLAIVNGIELSESFEDTIFEDAICWELLSPHYDINTGIRSYDGYRVESRDAGFYFVLCIQDKEYRLSDIFDYGELDILIYEHNKNKLLFLGMVDLYGSTYLIYSLYNGRINRIGDLGFMQSEDVECTGSKLATFNVQQVKDTLFIDLLLDDKWTQRYIGKLSNHDE